MDEPTTFEYILLCLVGFPWAAIIFYVSELINEKTNWEVPVWLQALLVVGGNVFIIIYAINML